MWLEFRRVLFRSKLTTKNEVIINACTSLEEVGTCDKNYGMSPIFYAEKLGILEDSYISGCVHIGKDEIDLIKQSNAKIIITPSTSMGKGEGIPPLRMMLSLGVSVMLGTGVETYNSAGSIEFESKLISLAVSGLLRTENAIDEKQFID